ncbi:MAG TPA: alpha/beta hydrolase [Fibrobacteres bacterium]|jgi:acetyl esterase/lipase|nr:alpha/beta hydrolase [Fibrobacterota bacterium]
MLFHRSKAALAVALIIASIQLVSGQAVELLWKQRKAPWPLPVPSGLDTTKALTDTTKNPYLALYPVTGSNANGAAVVICPGGGYTSLSAFTKEGVDIAKWINKLGVSAFVLRYRLGNSSGTAPFQHPIEMWDLQRAMRWVRANASRFNIDVRRVGIVGFSAGGHLASTVATHYDLGSPDSTSIDFYPGAKDSIDTYSCKPDFQVLGYPVITMDASFTHAGSRTALLGNNPSAALINLMSNEKQVTSSTPPAFMVHTTNDGTVPVKNSQVYADSLQKKGVTHKFLLYAMGSHGFGLADGKDGAPNYVTPPNDIIHWPDSAGVWMQTLGVLTPTAILQPRKGMSGTLQSDLKNSEVPDALGRLSKHPIKTHLPYLRSSRY